MLYFSLFCFNIFNHEFLILYFIFVRKDMFLLGDGKMEEDEFHIVLRDLDEYELSENVRKFKRG